MEAAKISTSTPPLPSVQDVFAMGYGDLIELCNDLDLSGQFNSWFQCLEALLGHYRCKGWIKHEEPLFVSTVETIYEQFAKKRQTLRDLVDRVRNFVTKEEYKFILEKFLPAESISREDWKLKDCEEGLPSILVAGSTSSGKTTLVNALLGAEILPIHHNASTAVLCEIKYSTDGTKFAIAHFETKEVERLDLCSDEGIHLLKEYAQQGRGVLSQDQDEDICSNIEIFWPQSFLQHMTLVDSPGTTDDARYSDITKRYQTGVASGFIYVVNSTLAAEEAAKVGKLLEAVTNDSKAFPSPRSAIFVLNKWDMFCKSNKEEAERHEFKVRFCKELETTWPGFKEDQLITMNSLLALKARQYGVNTQDVNNLCDKLRTLLPSSMDKMLQKCLEKAKKDVDEIERSLENTIRQFKLPIKERLQKHTNDMENIGEFERAMKECKITLNAEIEEHTLKLHDYLQSPEGRAQVLSYEDLKFNVDPRRQYETDPKFLQETLESAVVASIPHYSGFNSIVEWANSPKVKDNLTQILEHFGAMGADFNCPLDTTEVAVDVTEESYVAKVCRALLVGIPLFILGVAILPLSVVLQPVTICWLVNRGVRYHKLRSLLKERYDEFLRHQKEHNYENLKSFVERYIATVSHAIYYVYNIIPKKIERLKKELRDRLQRDAKNEPSYWKVLKSCQSVKGALCKFLIDLDIHEYTEDDIIWSIGRKREGYGAFGTVYKVALKRKEEQEYTALKVLHDEVNDTTARLFVNERDSCRKFKHENLVRLLGTVVLPNFEGVRRAAFLFEWCDGKTLRDELKENYAAPAELDSATARAKTVVTQIAEGLCHLHNACVVHRDIKPENILLTGGNRSVKIADMGLIKDAEQAKTNTGTPMYMAPEVSEKRPYGSAADIYSLGVVLIEIWFGKLPSTLKASARPLRDQLTDLQWSEDTVEDKRPGKLWTAVTKRCCNKEELNRPRAKDVLKLMKDWDNDVKFYTIV